MFGHHCCVCGTVMHGEMCPSRYLSDHGQDMRNKVALIVFSQMVADNRMQPSRSDWEYAWRWRNEEPNLSVMPLPG